MDDTGIVIAFWVLSAMTVGAALGVVVVRNIIHAVVFLVVCFLGLAGLYITLSADFIAVAQMLIYVGAITILLLFAIILTPEEGRNNAEGFLRLPAVALAILTSALLIFVALDTSWTTRDDEGFQETAAAIGELLLDKYVLPFEIASVLLLIALIGAITLVRPEPVEEDQA
jgi:NADH-quinone oxidoreductase subunit J